MAEPGPPALRRLLYVDDDAAFRRLVARRLRPFGFEIVEAATGREGQEAAAAERFDAVALDHQLPDCVGLDILDALGGGARDVPIIYVTGADNGRLAVTALKGGAADYIIKSTGGAFFELLAATLDQAISAAENRRQRAAAEAAERTARERAELLLREVNHRVANSLALVASLAQMQAAALEDETAREALRAMHRRITAIGQVHRRLYTSEDVQWVALCAYLQGLVEELKATAEESVELSLESPPVLIETDKAVAVGIIVSELVTNACKYAYPPGQQGEIRVRLVDTGDGHAEIVVEDDGVGFAPGKAQGSGLGSRILEAMARGLGGSLVYRPHPRGTCAVARVRLTLRPEQPLSSSAAPPG